MISKGPLSSTWKTVKNHFPNAKLWWYPKERSHTKYQFLRSHNILVKWKDISPKLSRYYRSQNEMDQQYNDHGHDIRYAEVQYKLICRIRLCSTKSKSVCMSWIVSYIWVSVFWKWVKCSLIEGFNNFLINICL